MTLANGKCGWSMWCLTRSEALLSAELVSSSLVKSFFGYLLSCVLAIVPMSHPRVLVSNTLEHGTSLLLGTKNQQSIKQSINQSFTSWSDNGVMPGSNGSSNYRFRTLTCSSPLCRVCTRSSDLHWTPGKGSMDFECWLASEAVPLHLAFEGAPRVYKCFQACMSWVPTKVVVHSFSRWSNHDCSGRFEIHTVPRPWPTIRSRRSLRWCGT